MKQINLTYKDTVFQDTVTGKTFMMKSTIDSAKTINIEGQTYPLVIADVTSDSHPFWTGNKNIVDAEGRVTAFNRRYGKKRPDLIK